MRKTLISLKLFKKNCPVLLVIEILESLGIEKYIRGTRMAKIQVSADKMKEKNESLQMNTRQIEKDYR